jgi:hypothetical protein
MHENSKPCPQCGAQMQFRLGEYQCQECTHTEALPWEERPEARGAQAGFTVKPLELGEQRAPNAWRGSFNVKEAHVDAKPVLDAEKIGFICVFALMALIRLALSATIVKTAPGELFSAFGAQLLNLAFLIGILYLPLIWAKWCCATYSCFTGVVTLAAGLFASAAIPMLDLAAGGSGPGAGNFAVVIATILVACVYIWFASILYRDIQDLPGGD